MVALWILLVILGIAGHRAAPVICKEQAAEMWTGTVTLPM
jgi:hypothetical protein